MKFEIKQLLWLQILMLLVGIAGTIFLSNYARSMGRSSDQEQEKSFSYYHEQIKGDAGPDQPREKIFHLASDLNDKLAGSNAEASALWNRLNRLFVRLGVSFVILCVIHIVVIVRFLRVDIGQRARRDDEK